MIRWQGWPACRAGARAAVIGFLLLSAVLVSGGLGITHLLSHSVGQWDDQVNAGFARHRTSIDNRLTGDFTVLANAPCVVTIVAGVALIAIVRRRARFALLAVIGVVTEFAGFLLCNYVVARPRPRVPHVGSTPSTFSWPSGHVAATFVLFGAIALIVTKVTTRLLPRLLCWSLVAVLTMCVALSRIYRGDHHPTDAIAGLVLGAGALWIAARAVRAGTEADDRGTVP